MKTKKRDRFPLPSILTAPMASYIETARAFLMSGRNHDALWVTNDGRRLSPRGLTAILERRTEERFGMVFRTHRFRHCGVSTMTTHLPQYPALAAAMLGISARVVEAHYDRSDQTIVGRSFLDFREAAQSRAVEDHARRQRLANATRDLEK